MRFHEKILAAATAAAIALPGLVGPASAATLPILLLT